MNIGPAAYDAVELMVQLATADREVTAGELAAQLARSLSYTEALLARLRSCSLVKTVRGHGYRLARPAALISAADVFEAVYRGRATPAARRYLPYLQPRDAVIGTDLLQESFMAHIMIFLRGVRLADLLPDSAITDAGTRPNSFADQPYRSSDPLHGVGA
jgi:DNA-binding IscR family transcriptional regulator